MAALADDLPLIQVGRQLVGRIGHRLLSRGRLDMIRNRTPNDAKAADVTASVA